MSNFEKLHLEVTRLVFNLGTFKSKSYSVENLACENFHSVIPVNSIQEHGRFIRGKSSGLKIRPEPVESLAIGAKPSLITIE